MLVLVQISANDQHSRPRRQPLLEGEPAENIVDQETKLHMPVLCIKQRLGLLNLKDSSLSSQFPSSAENSDSIRQFTYCKNYSHARADTLLTILIVLHADTNNVRLLKHNCVKASSFAPARPGRLSVDPCG